jgi:squalene synthase HpnC
MSTKSSLTLSEGERTMSDLFFTRDEMLSKARHENFPVASRFLPSGVRSDLLATYGFARLADDLGDESDGDRLALLDLLDADLVRAASGTARHRVLQELTPVIRKFDLSLDPFRRLIEANRIDQRVHSYESFDDLVGYCTYSATPVGQLVLSVFGLATSERIVMSDKVCIGLQLVEFLQDIKEDAQRGRVYLPVEDLKSFGCTSDDLVEASASSSLRSLVAMQVERAREFLSAGTELAASLPLRPRVAVVGFAAGGSAALDAINRAGNDVLQFRCRPNKRGLVKRALPKFVASSLRRSAR